MRQQIAIGVGLGALAIVLVLVVQKHDKRPDALVSPTYGEIAERQPTAVPTTAPTPQPLRRIEKTRAQRAELPSSDEPVRFVAIEEIEGGSGLGSRKQGIEAALKLWGYFVEDTDLTPDKQRRVLQVLADAQQTLAGHTTPRDDPSYDAREWLQVRRELESEVNADVERRVAEILTDAEMRAFRRYIRDADFFLAGQPLAVAP